MENRLYPKSYNVWAGNPAGVRPDYTRCCEAVVPNERGGSWHQHQCNRKRGFGPDEAYCKQHDPAAAQKRREASDRKYNEEFNKRRYEWHGKKFFDALQVIANGHNDARQLAKDVIDEFMKGHRNID